MSIHLHESRVIVEIMTNKLDTLITIDQYRNLLDQFVDIGSMIWWYFSSHAFDE